MAIKNNVMIVRQRLLTKLVSLWNEGALVEKIDRVPIEFSPRNTKVRGRCCIHKERAVWKYKSLPLLGYDMTDETDELMPLSSYAKMALDRKKVKDNIMCVIDEACSSCVRTNYDITNLCRGCVARACEHACPKNAIEFDPETSQGKINHSICISCGKCFAACPYHAIVYIPVPCEEACPVGAITKDENGVEHTKYRPLGTPYNPDGSLGVPLVGLHYQFTASVAGTIKIGIWINKGNRNFYVVDGTTALPIKPKFEGYINGQNETYTNEAGEEASRKKYLTNEEIQALHDAAKVDAATGVDNAPYVVGAGNQPFFGYVVFDMEPGKTYYVFNDNTQVGFNGWEFTTGDSTGIENVETETNANAPVYSISGQQVAKNYKGLVIKNGKKFINK